jgi:hypothetical protein
MEHSDGGRKRLEAALARVQRLKQDAYEDYRDKLLSREEFLRYSEDYALQEEKLAEQLAALEKRDASKALPPRPWVDELLRTGQVSALDRAALAQAVEVIRVFEGRHIEITYRFSDALSALLEKEL